MENLIYQITNEIKCLDAYVNAMKKVENSKPVLEDLENLQIHINNLKAWAGIDVDTSENGLHKHFVSGSTEKTYEEETRNAYYCNACGALEEFDCCCEDEDDWEDDEDDMLLIAGSCRCGAYRIENNKVLHVADCVCGAD